MSGAMFLSLGELRLVRLAHRPRDMAKMRGSVGSISIKACDWEVGGDVRGVWDKSCLALNRESSDSVGVLSDWMSITSPRQGAKGSWFLLWLQCKQRRE